MIHVHQCFNAVGHGTFFNGLIYGDPYAGSFSWIYDCGSKRTTRISQEITSLEDWDKWPKQVDLLVLSHFDDDHVNGVEQLLRSTRVKVLALPYMDIGQSLGGATSVNTDPCTVSTAAFQLDPPAWLQSRGLAGQVDTVLLVQGGPRSDGDPPVDGGPAPFPGDPSENSEREQEVRASTKGTSSLHLASAAGAPGKAAAPKTLFWKHGMSIASPGAPFELMFFNSTQPDLFHTDGAGVQVARRSRRSTSVVQADVDAVVRRYGLHDLSHAPRKGWRDALRGVYVTHFGATSQQRNNISLCLLTRPMTLHSEPCSIFRGRDGLALTGCHRVLDVGRTGTLLLGDLRINDATLAEMNRHFGAARWAEIGTVQVPHHGSQHSWEPGSAAAFGTDRFVHCVPDASSHHPHRSVESDLRPTNVLRADYRERVVIDYHFPL